MKLSATLQQFAEEAKRSETYWVEKAKLSFALSLESQRTSSKMTYAAVAKKIGTSAAYITKVFRGDTNVTIETMVKLARATGGELQVEVVDCSAGAACWTLNNTGRRYTKSNTDTMKAWRHLPLLQVDDLFAVVPHDCVPVAVDLLDDASDLRTYVHPERAFYIFGPEDGTLGKDIVARCRDKVFVPTAFCMNLAAAVNVVLYDRMSKRGAA